MEANKVVWAVSSRAGEASKAAWEASKVGEASKVAWADSSKVGEANREVWEDSKAGEGNQEVWEEDSKAGVNKEETKAGDLAAIEILFSLFEAENNK